MFIPDEKPVRAEIPDPPNVKKLVAGYKGKKEIAVGEEFDPSPANIDKRTKSGSLNSGLEYSLLSKETEEMLLWLRWFFGTEQLRVFMEKSRLPGLPEICWTKERAI